VHAQMSLNKHLKLNGSNQGLKSWAIEFSGSLAKMLFYRYSGAIWHYSALMSTATAISSRYSGAILAL